jgi:hypothetical protein
VNLRFFSLSASPDCERIFESNKSILGNKDRSLFPHELSQARSSGLGKIVPLPSSLFLGERQQQTTTKQQ